MRRSFAMVLFFCAVAAPAWTATVFTVNSENEFDALQRSGTVQGGDTIQFGADFDVFTREAVARRFNLDNAGTEAIIIDGQNDITFTGSFTAQNYFDIESGPFIFRNLVFDNVITSQLFQLAPGGGGHLTLENVTVNNVTVQGSVINVNSDNSLSIRGSSFIGNTTSNQSIGSGRLHVINSRGSTAISDSTFSDNDAASVLTSRGQLVLDQVVMENNTVDSEALVVSCAANTTGIYGYDISDSSFIGNTIDGFVSTNCLGVASPKSISDSVFGTVSGPSAGPGIITVSHLDNVTIGGETFNPSIIPLPAGMWLLLSGLGLIALRRAA